MATGGIGREAHVVAGSDRCLARLTAERAHSLEDEEGLFVRGVVVVRPRPLARGELIEATAELSPTSGVRQLLAAKGGIAVIGIGPLDLVSIGFPHG